jgi:aminopeptidase N
LATNEAKHEWMDEGFTSYISNEALSAVNEDKNKNPQAGSYKSYYSLVKSGQEHPQTTHADRYTTNRSYGISAYSKGAVFLAQLEYVIGRDNLKKTLKRYFHDFSFKHPTPNDFIRSAEKVSGMELDWYLTDWTQTTNTIDYAVKKVLTEESKTSVVLERKGLMPMPIDLSVTYKDGSKESYYIPLQMMRGKKPNQNPNLDRMVLHDWAWAFPEYSFDIDNSKEIKNITIDISGRMADIDLENNTFGE